MAHVEKTSCKGDGMREETVEEHTAFLDHSELEAQQSPDPHPSTNHDAKFSQLCSIILGGFALYSLRIPLVPQLWNGIGLKYFIPVVSPVYREGEHWQASERRAAILLHCVCGAAMLWLGVVQADRGFRKQNPGWHKWCGRAYVLCGLVTIGAYSLLQTDACAQTLSCTHCAPAAPCTDTDCVLVGAVRSSPSAARFSGGRLIKNTKCSFNVVRKPHKLWLGRFDIHGSVGCTN